MVGYGCQETRLRRCRYSNTRKTDKEENIFRYILSLNSLISLSFSLPLLLPPSLCHTHVYCIAKDGNQLYIVFQNSPQTQKIKKAKQTSNFKYISKTNILAFKLFFKKKKIITYLRIITKTKLFFPPSHAGYLFSNCILFL